MTVEQKDSYNAKYLQHNFFQYREWLYAPYISSLMSYCRIRPGSFVLDVGCGQGFFSYLLHKSGMTVHGIDMSEIGVHHAESLYGRPGVTFEVADIDTVVFSAKFDCVFVRSCSLYNSEGFPLSDSVTEKLLSHLKEKGTFVFLYNSRFSSRTSSAWRCHSLTDVKRHFHRYGSKEVFFSNKIDTLLLGKYAFNRLITRMNMLFSKVSGAGGDLICVLRKPGKDFAPARTISKRDGKHIHAGEGPIARSG